jgi:hypothetical protein
MDKSAPLILLLLSCTIISQISLLNAPTASASEAWQETARGEGLSDKDIEQLHENQLLIGDRAFRQMYEAYKGRGTVTPKFITSDAVLNAYHVLYEESLRRLEIKRATRFPQVLKCMIQNLNSADRYLAGQSSTVRKAKKRAQLVLGVALRLMDEEFKFANEDLNTVLVNEVQKITQASVRELPLWLGPPDGTFLTLDYSRYRPRGFYTSLPSLERYFRSMAWLQSIPFRIYRDHELLAFLMLAHSVYGSQFQTMDLQTRSQAYLRGYRMFIGLNDNRDLMTLAPFVHDSLVMNLNKEDLKRTRETIIRSLRNMPDGPLINDQIALKTEDKTAVEETAFRIISPYRTPSAILFRRTTEYGLFQRPFPSGLEICVALGSSLARELIDDPQKDLILAAIDRIGPIFKGESLYFTYLDTLATLLDKPDAKAPDFMNSHAWQRKSCNTVLGGCTQLRHTWLLRAKQSVATAGMTKPPPGFVEPEPAFFSCMADLAETTNSLLEAENAFAPDYTFLLGKLALFEECLEGVSTWKEMYSKFSELPKNSDPLSDLYSCTNLTQFLPVKAQPRSQAYYAELKQQVRQLIETIKRGDFEPTGEFLETINTHHKFDLASLWTQFAETCRKLETISRKQMEGVPLNSKEDDLIKHFGHSLARFTLHGSTHFPRDDAPRVADVFFNPQMTPAYFHMGIGRPRVFYVLYPWEGQQLLCKGAIAPYYEHIAAERLTNSSWLKKLDSKQSPPLPAWADPIYSKRH